MCSIPAPESVRCCEGSKKPIAEATATAVSSASPVIMHNRVEHAFGTNPPQKKKKMRIMHGRRQGRRDGVSQTKVVGIQRGKRQILSHLVAKPRYKCTTFPAWYFEILHARNAVYIASASQYLAWCPNGCHHPHPNPSFPPFPAYSLKKHAPACDRRRRSRWLVEGP